MMHFEQIHPCSQTGKRWQRQCRIAAENKGNGKVDQPGIAAVKKEGDQRFAAGTQRKVGSVGKGEQRHAQRRRADHAGSKLPDGGLGVVNGGSAGLNRASSVPITAQLETLRVIIRHAVRRAPVMRLAPSSCPTRMAVALPSERKTSLKKSG